MCIEIYTPNSRNSFIFLTVGFPGGYDQYQVKGGQHVILICQIYSELYSYFTGCVQGGSETLRIVICLLDIIEDIRHQVISKRHT